MSKVVNPPAGSLLADLPPLLTPEAFQTLTGVPKATQATWRCTGRHGLPFVKIGKAVRYRREDVAAWIEARTVRPGGAE